MITMKAGKRALLSYVVSFFSLLICASAFFGPSIAFAEDGQSQDSPEILDATSVVAVNDSEYLEFTSDVIGEAPSENDALQTSLDLVGDALEQEQEISEDIQSNADEVSNGSISGASTNDELIESDAYEADEKTKDNVSESLSASNDEVFVDAKSVIDTGVETNEGADSVNGSLEIKSNEALVKSSSSETLEAESGGLRVAATKAADASEITGRPVDFIFVVDTTGSMEGDISKVRSALSTCVETLEDEYLIDMSISVVEFRDYFVDGGTASMKIYTFSGKYWTSDVDSVLSVFNKWDSSYVSGGGDYPETPTYAITQVLEKTSFRSYSDRFVFLLTDAEYKETSPVPSMKSTISALKKESVHTIVVSTSSMKDVYADLYNSTDGVFIDINSSDDAFTQQVIEAIGELTKKSYDTQYSNMTFADCVYTGSYLEPSIRVVINGKILVEGRDYTIVWGNNVNAGSTAYATIYGIGLYEGTKTATFVIAPAVLSNCTIKFNSVVYCGSARTPVPSRISYRGMDLVKGVDYKVVRYTNNVNAGTAYAVLQGIGNYSETITIEFVITPARITWATVTTPTVTYCGSARTPLPNTVVWGDLILENGRDFKVVYHGNNVNAGTAYLVLDGIGNYAGRVSVDFIIRPAVLSWASFTVTSVTYTGSPLTPDPSSVTWNGMTLVKGRDFTIVAHYRNVNANDGAYIVIDGVGNYSGRTTVSFIVNPAPISCVNIEITEVTYNGSARTPSPSRVFWNGMTLVKGRDYKIAGHYRNIDANAGAYIVIDGLGNYTGRTTQIFIIKPAQIAWASVEMPETTFTGSARTPSPSLVTWNGMVLVKDRDYKVFAHYRNINANDGAYVVIDGLGNYAGRRTANFTINPAKLSWADFAVEGCTYSGLPQMPSILSATWNGNTLKSSRDYDVVGYVNNVNASSSAYILAEGRGNYEGSKMAFFTIDPAPISNVDFAIPNVTYTGSARTPAPSSATWNGMSLVRGVDYKVSAYYRNTEANGGAYAVIDGIGNYAGRTTVSFTIDPASLSWVEVAIDPVGYNGSARTPAPSAVTWNNMTLVKDKDYKVVRFGNNVDASSGAYVELQGLGNYAGGKTANFTINPAKISWASVSNVPQKVTYTGNAVSLSPIVTLWGATLNEGTDYTVRYYDSAGAPVNPTSIGTYTMIIKGIGNYISEIVQQFNIV